MRKTEAIYSELAIGGNQPPSLVFGKDSKAGRELGNLYNEKKLEGFTSILNGGHCPREVHFSSVQSASCV